MGAGDLNGGCAGGFGSWARTVMARKERMEATWNIISAKRVGSLQGGGVSAGVAIAMCSLQVKYVQRLSSGV